jgi:hypothetical protein
VMKSIVASGPSDGNRKQHVFLVKWEDFTDKENMWETYDNVTEHGDELLEEYYKKNVAVEKDARIGKKNGRKKKRKRTYKDIKIVGEARNVVLFCYVRKEASLRSPSLEKGVMLGVVS